MAHGQIVILNGTPRSGKTSIVRALQPRSTDLWINLGVDLSMEGTPEQYQPGIGLRPGGERPDLEPVVQRLYRGLFGAIAEHCTEEINVVVDIGIHDGYSRPLGIRAMAAEVLMGLPVLLVGVRCPIETIAARRGIDPTAIPEPVLRWQAAVHDPGIYDLEVDTSRATPEQCAETILAMIPFEGDALSRVGAWQGSDGAR